MTSRNRQWRLGRLGRSRLYLCTDSRGSLDDFAAFVEAAYAGGVDIIQLRDKHIDALSELRFLSVLSDAALRHDALFAVNDRADIAAVSDADIVHVGQDDLPVAETRQVVGREVLIGRSTHSVDQAREARLADTDYYCIGPVWATPTKQGRPEVGVDAVRAVAQQADDKPWFGIGGVNAQNLAQVTDAGATRIVVVRALTGADDPAAAARELLARL
ncbi:thiamine phosphate synthase [Propionibacterium freudenreichii]|uniref:thiamine phosphate synthase n=1 Tax=Propionibacterium freudenreichii TaxID=1744 RepID=UPI00254AAE29|nr:thiamine phosphate synthase [Propionibacterium freudenreichii]MDK9331046.1 thiamine phosphate synthase [Propionibacterium freudenreichii]